MQLRTRTLAQLKDEISLSLDSLMDEIGNVHDARTMRAVVEQMFKRKPYAGGSKVSGHLFLYAHIVGFMLINDDY